MEKKKDLPAHPWYWGDWFKAMDVQSLSRENRCVWFEMIGRMWESNERGYLVINGKPPTNEELAQMLGFGQDTILLGVCLDLLESKGIFSRDERGIIYCRKILRDLEISEKRANAGRKGGICSSKTKAKGKICSSNRQALAQANTEDETETENATELPLRGKNLDVPLPF